MFTWGYRITASVLYKIRILSKLSMTLVKGPECRIRSLWTIPNVSFQFLLFLTTSIVNDFYFISTSISKPLPLRRISPIVMTIHGQSHRASLIVDHVVGSRALKTGLYDA